METVKSVPKEFRPYVIRYDDIEPLVFEGKDGWYCNSFWYSTYEFAWNSRAASILGG